MSDEAQDDEFDEFTTLLGWAFALADDYLAFNFEFVADRLESARA